MTGFDRAILEFLNQFAQRSVQFDKFVDMLFGNMLVEGGFITALLWWAWFRNRDTAERDRSFVMSGIVLAMIGLGITRFIALTVPFRHRPRYIPDLHFKLPYGSANYDMFNWSSFPSDHAVLYFCLAVTIFFVSRRAGVIALLHAFFVVCLTRVYLGIHYPTDILAGMAIGTGMACLSLSDHIRMLITRPAQWWLKVSPRSFYPALSLTMLMIASEFDPLHEALVDVWRAAKALI